MSHHLHTAMALNRTLGVVEAVQVSVAQNRAYREQARVEGVDAVSRLAIQLRSARSEQALAVAKANALGEANMDLRRRLALAEARAIRPRTRYSGTQPETRESRNPKSGFRRKTGLSH